MAAKAAATASTAAANAEVVVLAVPWSAEFETLGLLGDQATDEADVFANGAITFPTGGLPPELDGFSL